MDYSIKVFDKSFRLIYKQLTVIISVTHSIEFQIAMWVRPLNSCELFPKFRLIRE